MIDIRKHVSQSNRATVAGARKQVKARHPHLVVSVPPVHPDLILGLYPVIGHLPQVLRLPGEPLDCLLQRALALATGRGRFAVICIVRGVSKCNG